MPAFRQNSDLPLGPMAFATTSLAWRAIGVIVRPFVGPEPRLAVCRLGRLRRFPQVRPDLVPRYPSCGRNRRHTFGGHPPNPSPVYDGGVGNAEDFRQSTLSTGPRDDFFQFHPSNVGEAYAACQEKNCGGSLRFFVDANVGQAYIRGVFTEGTMFQINPALSRNAWSIRNEWSAEEDLLEADLVLAHRRRERAAIAAFLAAQDAAKVRQDVAEFRQAALAWAARARDPRRWGYPAREAGGLKAARDRAIKSYLAAKRLVKEEV